MGFPPRITPAYAGKSSLRYSVDHLHGDHPRLCGEKPTFQQSLHVRPGSPPPMRGKAAPNGYVVSNDRITPAYAGKRGRWQPKIAGIQDHPRLCGEKKSLPAVLYRSPGSPPPMRGKAPLMTKIFLAGEDHPRLCGEKFSIKSTKSNCPGSPPPMRGKETSLSDLSQLFRITPAYAGKSQRIWLQGAGSQDHPRLCGEKSTLKTNTDM